MAELTDRLPDNSEGRFYVDSSCIDCDQCRSHAPEFFSRNDDLGMSIVHQQPATPAEIDLCEEALAGCPSESIGNNG